MEGLELACFEIISNVGTAKSCYINAIHKAKEGDYEEAKKLIEEGNKMVKVHPNNKYYCLQRLPIFLIISIICI